VPLPPGGARVRAAHHAFDAVEILALGLLCGLALGTLGHALRHHRRAAFFAYLAPCVALSYLVLGSDLRHQADYLIGGVPADLLTALMVGACGLAVPVAHGLGAWCGRRRILKWIAPIVALGGVVTSHLIVRDDYAPMHAAIEWTAATLAFASLSRLVARIDRRRAGHLAFAALGLAGAAGLVVFPSNRTRLELFKSPGAIGAWTFARTLWPRPTAGDGGPAVPAPRFAETATPPTAPPLVEGAPVVVLITIDATRADVVLDKERSALPFFSELGRTAAVFTRAVSPGSQTSVSLSTLFSGRYFSQLYWSRYGSGPARFLYPAEDSTPRFPEILGANGVHTALFGGTNFLANEYGVARGFAETHVPNNRRHAMANEVLDPLIERLGHAGKEPLFLYAHIMEPHAPYDRGKKKGTDFERYVSEIGVADAMVARVARTLAQRFPTRGVLIVSADHGEAFGEHGTHQHTKTIYDELLRVPLFVRAAGVRPRSIDTRVGLVDLGPTLLDLFGIATPPGFMGQSLVPLLRGDGDTLTRPVLAEGRLRRALYVDNIKVIEDLRRNVVEAYDLDRDPDEASNLFDAGDPRAEAGLAALRAFFAAYELRRPGYTTPYKP
jgi:arylsulfatase A-like enzyme